MKILTNEKWNELIRENRKLKRENDRLKDQLYKIRKINLSSIYGCMHQDIDFPNSSKEPISSDDIFFN